MSGSDGDCVCVPPPSGAHHSGDSEAMLLHPQQVKVQHSSVTFQIVFKGKCDGGVVCISAAAAAMIMEVELQMTTDV